MPQEVVENLDSLCRKVRVIGDSATSRGDILKSAALFQELVMDLFMRPLWYDRKIDVTDEEVKADRGSLGALFRLHRAVQREDARYQELADRLKRKR